jgi:feruloyl esterase
LTVVGKALTARRYGRQPDRSYWVGCSTGGRQGLKEAQRYPEDYDGIVAGAPASNWSALMALSIVTQRNLGEGGLGVEKLGLLKEAAIAACDVDDGVADRVITNFATCAFDPASLQCAAAPTAQCLNPTEVAAARRIYAGVVRSGETVMPGTGVASEPLWAAYASQQFAIGTNYFRNIVARDPNWNPATFDVDRDLAAVEAADNGAADAMNPDLSEFVGRGGKLITYHGTTDGLIPFGNSVAYHEAVVDELGARRSDDSVKFYLVPGMDHCSGGEGAFAIDWLTPLESWVERGEAPAALQAAHPAGAPPGPPGASPAPPSSPFTRPVCPYPQVPTYDGTGDIADAASFDCVAPQSEGPLRRALQIGR